MLVILNTTFDSLKKNYKLKMLQWDQLVCKTTNFFFLIENEQELSTAYFIFQKKCY